MPKYNDNFELSVEDMEIIEDALRREKRVLSNKSLSTGECDAVQDQDAGELDNTVRQIHDLLGRLHNQKVFYRPQTGAYVGG